MSKYMPQRPPDSPTNYYAKKRTHEQWFKHFAAKPSPQSVLDPFSIFFWIEVAWWHYQDARLKGQL